MCVNLIENLHSDAVSSNAILIHSTVRARTGQADKKKKKKYAMVNESIDALCPVAQLTSCVFSRRK